VRLLVDLEAQAKGRSVSAEHPAACEHGHAPGECPEDGCLYRREVKNQLLGLECYVEDEYGNEVPS
jgi:hypothetical protein